jgi:alginate O-acetyltransferase complex protein AlgI
MIGMNGLIGDMAAWQAVTRESLALALLATVVVFAEPHLFAFFSEGEEARFRVGADGTATIDTTRQVVDALSAVVIGTIAILKLAEQSFSPFLYFQF